MVARVILRGGMTDLRFPIKWLLNYKILPFKPLQCPEEL
jgi:hypothetical protein